MENMKRLSISFSGGAWHCSYHLGVTTQIQKYFTKLIQKNPEQLPLK
jgi:hypothetical protein